MRFARSLAARMQHTEDGVASSSYRYFNRANRRAEIAENISESRKRAKEAKMPPRQWFFCVSLRFSRFIIIFTLCALRVAIKRLLNRHKNAMKTHIIDQLKLFIAQHFAEKKEDRSFLFHLFGFVFARRFVTLGGDRAADPMQTCKK